MQYPVIFKAQSQTTSGIKSLWTIQSYNNQTNCSIPPEFNGPGGGFSPEDLFAQALTNCFIATFKVYAENSKLDFNEVKVDTELIVDKSESKKIVMKSCQLNITISGPSSTEKAELLVKKAMESGFILNSVKTDVTYNLFVK